MTGQVCAVTRSRMPGRVQQVKVGIERPVTTTAVRAAVARGWQVWSQSAQSPSSAVRVGGGEDRCDRLGGDHRAGAGRSWPSRSPSVKVLIGEVAAWAQHRSRRVATRTATKNQLLGQLDRAFPGLTLALPDVLGTKIGLLVAAEFADPARLATLGVNRLIRFAAARDCPVTRPVAERLVTAAKRRLAHPRRGGGPTRAEPPT